VQPIVQIIRMADDLNAGVIDLMGWAAVQHYIEAEKQQRVWGREVRLPESAV
jgi:hypothetical protein